MTPVTHVPRACRVVGLQPQWMIKMLASKCWRQLGVRSMGASQIGALRRLGYEGASAVRPRRGYTTTVATPSRRPAALRVVTASSAPHRVASPAPAATQQATVGGGIPRVRMVSRAERARQVVGGSAGGDEVRYARHPDEPEDVEETDERDEDEMGKAGAATFTKLKSGSIMLEGRPPAGWKRMCRRLELLHEKVTTCARLDQCVNVPRVLGRCFDLDRTFL